jgi:glycerol-3-phosphate dehydrogenase
MWVYELLSGFENHRLHRFLPVAETVRIAPGLPREGLQGGCLYYDAVVSDGRWTIETVKDGVRCGGVAVNYAAATALLKANGRVVGAVVRDERGGSSYEIRARSVVNATGVFADRIRQLDRPDAPPLIRLSKGTHLVFAEEDVPLDVTTVFSSPVDGRALFLIKRDGCFLYGTTDDWEEADAGAPVPGGRDVEYLLDSLDAFLPVAGLDGSKVRFVYSGFRPLLCAGGRASTPSEASREDQIEVTPSGLLSVVGGKLTTARLMATRVLGRLRRGWKGPARGTDCRTGRISIGGSNADVSAGAEYWAGRCPAMADYFRLLYRRYGLDARDICAEAQRIDEGGHADAGARPVRAEVQYVCRHEMVCTVADLIERRAGFLQWSPAERLDRLQAGAHVIQDELGVTASAFEGQLRDYRRYLQRFHSMPSAMAPRSGDAARHPARGV